LLSGGTMHLNSEARFVGRREDGSSTYSATRWQEDPTQRYSRRVHRGRAADVGVRAIARRSSTDQWSSTYAPYFAARITPSGPIRKSAGKPICCSPVTMAPRRLADRV